LPETDTEKDKHREDALPEKGERPESRLRARIIFGAFLIYSIGLAIMVIEDIISHFQI